MKWVTMMITGLLLIGCSTTIPPPSAPKWDRLTVVNHTIPIQSRGEV